MTEPDRESSFLLLLFGVYLLLKPFYILPGGYAQPSDLVLMASVILAFRKGILNHLIFSSSRLLKTLLYFTAYAVGVNLLWGLYLGERSALIVSAYCIFNYLLCCLLFGLNETVGSRFRKWVFYATSGAVITQALLLPLTQGLERFPGQSALEFSGRSFGFFSNPNQLGYWALLGASILVLGGSRAMLPIWLLLSAFICACYLCLSSLSKAAILALGLLIFIEVIRRFERRLLFGLLLGTLVFVPLSGHRLFQSSLARLGAIGLEEDDSIALRGYSRIVDFPQYLLLGAGEFAHQRFAKPPDLETLSFRQNPHTGREGRFSGPIFFGVQSSDFPADLKAAIKDKKMEKLRSTRVRILGPVALSPRQNRLLLYQVKVGKRQARTGWVRGSDLYRSWDTFSDSAPREPEEKGRMAPFSGHRLSLGRGHLFSTFERYILGETPDIRLGFNSDVAIVDSFPDPLDPRKVLFRCKIIEGNQRGNVALISGDVIMRQLPPPRPTHLEIHSTAGMLLFSYGIVGLVLVLRFFGVIIQRARWDFLYLLPAFGYGVFHNGFRFSIFWVLCLLVFFKEES